MAKEDQKKISDSEASFFNQQDYQKNAGVITFGLNNPVNKPLTDKDIENVNILAPLSFIQYKLSSDKNYQLSNSPNSPVSQSEEDFSSHAPETSETFEEYPSSTLESASITNEVEELGNDLPVIEEEEKESTSSLSAEEKSDIENATLNSDELSSITQNLEQEDTDDFISDFPETNSLASDEDNIIGEANDASLDLDLLNTITGGDIETDNIEGNEESNNNTDSVGQENLDIDDINTSGKSTAQSSKEPNEELIEGDSTNQAPNGLNTLANDFTLEDLQENDDEPREDEIANDNQVEFKTNSTLDRDELDTINKTLGGGSDIPFENDSGIANNYDDKTNLNEEGDLDDNTASIEPIKIKENFFSEELEPEITTETKNSSANLDEQALFSSFNQSLDSAINQKHKKQLLDQALENYKPENRDLILQSIQHRKIDDEQITALIDSIIKNSNETLVVETLNQQLLKKTGYEIFERRNRKQKQERIALNETFANYQHRRLLAGIAIASTFLLFLVLSIYFSYESILTYRLYQKAISAAGEEQYQDAEIYFGEAYKLKPQITPTRELAESYLKKNQIKLAQDKYNQLLLTFPNNIEVLLANTRFYRTIKDYERAKSLVNLGETKFPQNLGLYKEKTEILLEEGFNLKDYTLAQKNWQNAEKNFSDLLVKDPENQGLYLQRKLEIAAFEKDFSKGKNYYNLLQGINTKYDLRSMSRYLGFLIETQEHGGDPFYQVKPVTLTGIENVFITSAINEIIMQLEATYGSHYLINIEKARWALRRNSFDEARQLINMSIDSIRKEQNSLLNNELVYALNTAGMINIRQKQVIPALEYFQQSLAISPDDHIANYYVGKINLTELNQVIKSKEFFTRASENWFNPNDQRYIDVQYSLGYINFLQGKAETEPKNQEFYFKNSAEYWSDLLRNKLPEKNYLIVFNLATTYLYLKEYDLAQIFFESNLEELKPIFEYYQLHNKQLIREAGGKKDELEILSDVFNNLAVAQINSQTGGANLAPETEIPGVALEHLINSISLKDQLGVLKGVPYVNFNTINDYPKYAANFTAKRPLLIGDTFIPNSMFEKIF